MLLANHVIQADIDLSALQHNVRSLKQHIGPAVAMAAVVKADAYGHGAYRIARTALSSGADRLAVARFSEAERLRKEGITSPILLFGSTPAALIQKLLDWNLTVTVNSLEEAEELSLAAEKRGKSLPVHIKIDTGMGRLGLMHQDFQTDLESVEKIIRMRGLRIEGVFTHFANADTTDKTHVKQQLTYFSSLMNNLKKRGHEIPLRHAANSAATLELPESHFDMVRPGIALYGLSPSRDVNPASLSLRPVLSLRTRIIHIKTVPAGFHVSYGSTYTTPSESRIATVPVGYADGFPRSLSSKGAMLVHGQRAPILGRVCMDLTMIDVSSIPEARAGDEVIIIGRQAYQEISADEVAENAGTINYEVVSSLTGRIPRIYYS